MNTFTSSYFSVSPLSIHCDSIRYFSQLQVYETFFCHCKKTSALHLTKPTLQVCKVSMMDTHTGTSLEGQTLTGNVLVITGTLNTKLILTQKEHSACSDIVVDKRVPFSTDIVIPTTECAKSHIAIGYEIQDYDALIIQDNSLYIVISLLIAYNDCEM